MKKYKLNRKLITLNCDYCNCEYDKPVSEYHRNLKLGRRNFCSRKCSFTLAREISAKTPNPNRYKISNYSGNRDDKYTPFRYLFKSSKKKFKKFTITLEDIKQQWEKQKGVCPYSGIKLTLSTFSKICRDPIYSASLDRIDSNKGYIKDNIQIVSRSINFMKNTMSHEDTIKLCKLIANNYNT